MKRQKAAVECGSTFHTKEIQTQEEKQRESQKENNRCKILGFCPMILIH